jgi:hypothetical protein
MTNDFASTLGYMLQAASAPRKGQHTHTDDTDPLSWQHINHAIDHVHAPTWPQ